MKLHISILFLLLTIRGFPQAFSCDHTFYVIMQQDGKSVLHNMWFDASGQLNYRPIPLSQPQRRYACVGLSIEDLHLYALDYHSKELLRIDASGQVVSLGVPENLDTALEYRAGEVTPEGRRLMVIGYDPAFGRDRTVYAINLTVSNHYAGSSGMVSYLPTLITDVATDPIRGITYGFDRINKQIVVMGVNSVAHHNHVQVDAEMESLFFDERGNLYGYGSTGGAVEQSTIFAIDKVKGNIEPLAGHGPGSYSDGCSCAATFRFTRTVSPARVLPCSEITIDYWLTNYSGIGKTGIVFEDILPADWTITEVVEHTFTLATIESGPGTNHLYIPNLDVLIGENLIRIKATVGPTAAGTFETQAGLEDLPLGLGGSLLSDDLLSPEPADPNLTEVISSGEFRLEDHQRYNCAKDSLILSLPFDAQAYLWNTGAVSPTLLVTEAGQYWVEAVGECFSVRDTLHVAAFPEPLWVDLGPDREIREGTGLELAISTNAGEVRQLRWESEQEFDLSCVNCPDPGLIARQDNTYYLQLTDGTGCTATDSLQVRVLPVRNIYAPNAFSPNGDGINDLFVLLTDNTEARLLEFNVFDRWGMIAYSSGAGILNDHQYAWNGRMRGAVAPAGTYAWQAKIAFADGSVEQWIGEVALIR